MNIIEKIVVKCIKQNDLTGSDDLLFYVRNVFLGKVSISTGQTKEVDGASIIVGGGPIFIDAGDSLRIEEFDIADSNEVLFDHQFTEEEIGAMEYFDTYKTDADYEFTVVFS